MLAAHFYLVAVRWSPAYICAVAHNFDNGLNGTHMHTTAPAATHKKWLATCCRWQTMKGVRYLGQFLCCHSYLAYGHSRDSSNGSLTADTGVAVGAADLHSPSFNSYWRHANNCVQISINFFL